MRRMAKNNFDLQDVLFVFPSHKNTASSKKQACFSMKCLDKIQTFNRTKCNSGKLSFSKKTLTFCVPKQNGVPMIWSGFFSHCENALIESHLIVHFLCDISQLLWFPHFLFFVFCSFRSTSHVKSPFTCVSSLLFQKLFKGEKRTGLNWNRDTHTFSKKCLLITHCSQKHWSVIAAFNPDLITGKTKQRNLFMLTLSVVKITK